MTRHWNELSETEQLGSIYSDAHKDVFGFRPRHMTVEQLTSVEWLSNAIAQLDDMPVDDDDDEAPREYNDGANGYDDDPEDDGQPDEYTEWQDYFGGDEYYDHSEMAW